MLLITGTVGAGKTAVAREIGELLRLTGLATGMRMGCGVIDLDALSYVAAGPVEDRFNSNFVVDNLKAVWPNYAARGVERLVLAALSAQHTRSRPTARQFPPQPLRSVASPLRRKRSRTVCDDGSAESHGTSSWRCRIPWRRRPTNWHSKTSLSRTDPIDRSPMLHAR